MGGPCRVPRQVPPAPAREVARPDRRRDAISAALPRPHRQPRVPGGVRGAGPGARLDPPVHGAPRPRLPRGRDADDAADRGRRPRAPVRDPPQRAGHGALPAHRARALPQAARRRGHGAGLRDQPELPQRGHLDPAQPRVHDARVLSGLQRLPRPDDDDGADAGDGGARRRRVRPGPPTGWPAAGPGRIRRGPARAGAAADANRRRGAVGLRARGRGGESTARAPPVGLRSRRSTGVGNPAGRARPAVRARPAGRTTPR